MSNLLLRLILTGNEQERFFQGLLGLIKVIVTQVCTYIKFELTYTSGQNKVTDIGLVNS